MDFAVSRVRSRGIGGLRRVGRNWCGRPGSGLTMVCPFRVMLFGENVVEEKFASLRGCRGRSLASKFIERKSLKCKMKGSGRIKG